MHTIIKFSLASIFSLIGFWSLAQNQEEECLSHTHEMEMREKHPEIGTVEEFETVLSQKINVLRNSRKINRVRYIPIIFHIIHNGEELGNRSNISSDHIYAQINQLNADFRKIPGTSGANDHPRGADTFIEFAPAAIDTLGQLLAEPGINRINRKDMGWESPSYDRRYIESTIKPASYWNPDQYLNFWVMDLSGYLSGYAQFPTLSGLDGFIGGGEGAETDGIVCAARTIGSTDLPNPRATNTNSRGLGRTATHEIGHWLGLRHIWGDGPCGYDDFVEDTPGQESATSGCPTEDQVSCGSVDMIENYMDYTDDICSNIFTIGQKERMDVVLANSPRRASLLNSRVYATIPNLIISEVVDGNESEENPKYIELYNAGDQAIDLSNWVIKVFEDGNSTNSHDVQLSGMVEAEGTHVVANAEFMTAWGGAFATATPDQTSSGISGDGNDVYVLYEEVRDLKVDIFGSLGENGSSTDWGYQNGIATRKNYVLCPNYGNFDPQHWTFDDYDPNTVTPRTHFAEVPAFDVILGELTGIDNGKSYFTCSDSLEFLVGVEIINSGSQTITSVDIEVSTAEDKETLTAMFDEGLASGETSVKYLTPMIIRQSGEYSVSIAVNDINDGNPINNNSASVNFNTTFFKNPTDLTVSVQTDIFPEETSWRIENVTGDVLYRETGFVGKQMLYSETICLGDGDYLFVLEDSYGDGIFQGYASVSLGDFTLAHIPGDHEEFNGNRYRKVEIPFSLPIASVKITTPENNQAFRNACSPIYPLAFDLTNTGKTDISSFQFFYGSQEDVASAEAMSSTVDNINLAPGEKINIDLGEQNAVLGTNTAMILVTKVNNKNYTADDIVAFDLLENTSLTVSVKADRFVQDIGWRIEDSEGDIIYKETEFDQYKLNSQTVCLGDGDYLFVLEDSYGDGIFQGYASVSLGDFTLAYIPGDHEEFNTYPARVEYKEVAVPFYLPMISTDVKITTPESDQMISNDCYLTYPLAFDLTNTGKTDITSFQFFYGSQEDVASAEAMSSTVDNINLAPGEKINIDLGEQNAVLGTNTAMILVTEVNNKNYTAGDIVTFDFVENTSLSKVEIKLNFDEFSAETSWAIYDENDQTLAEGSDYLSELSNTTHTEILCVPSGCYDFEIMDNADNGGTRAEIFVDESFELTTSNEYGSGISKTFCTQDIPPNLPSDLTAVSLDAQAIELNWTDNSENEKSFTIQTSTSVDGSWNDLVELNSNIESYTDEGLEENVHKFYRIRSNRSWISSQWVGASDARTKTLSSYRTGS